VHQPEPNHFVTFRRTVLQIGCGLLVYAGCCLVQSPQVQQEAASVPSITCAELIKNGPGNKQYVALTDACLSSRPSVAERDSETGALEMYHPLYGAAHAQEPEPPDLALVLCIMDERERQRLRDDSKERQQLGQPGLSVFTGEVVKRADRLPQWARDGLREKYPGVVLGKCWVVTVGLQEPTERRAHTLWCYGIVASLAGGTLLVGWLAWRPARAVKRADQQLA